VRRRATCEVRRRTTAYDVKSATACASNLARRRTSDLVRNRLPREERNPPQDVERRDFGIHLTREVQLTGHVRCDGLVAATPAGSTGYNLANQGPILAWGVKGYAVSYISPHSLTARALVVAPNDVLSVGNAPGREPVDVAIDGAHACSLAPGASLDVRFADAVGKLAQLPGASFYHRIREKFGHLAV